jgi:hypothetical protein
MKRTWQNDENGGSVIEKIGQKIVESLPERYQTEEVARFLGKTCGFWSGYFFGKAIVRLLFPNNKEDEK